MNANFYLPTLTSTYANFLAEMKSRDEDIATWFDGTTSTNLPNKAKRWNETGKKFEKWNGTVWSDLATLYEIKARDSDRLNGQTASYYAVAGHSHTAATISANGFMSSADKSKLDGIAANANNYSHPTGDGNLHVPANGTANNGKFLQATAVAGSYVWASLPATSLSTLGITATTAELNILDGCTATAAELNKLDGVTTTATQFNYLNTLDSNVQTQLNAKAPLASPALTGTPTAPTAPAGTNTTQLATTAFVLNTLKHTAGAVVEAQSNTAFTSPTNTTASTKKKAFEARVGVGGVVTVSFSMAASHNSASYYTYGQIHVNGVAVGTLRTATLLSYTTFTENITVNAGDLVQIYIYGNTLDVDRPSTANYFKILTARPLTTQITFAGNAGARDV